MGPEKEAEGLADFQALLHQLWINKDPMIYDQVKEHGNNCKCCTKSEFLIARKHET
jgi:hypothetical protein